MKKQLVRNLRRHAFLRRGCVAVIAWILLLSALIPTASAAAVFPPDASPTSVYLEGKEILEGECIILKSVTYVPLRKFCNLFTDCSITWNAKTSTATVKSDALTMTVQSGAIYITANGRYFYTVGEVRNLNGHLYVPIRPLAKALALSVEWNAKQRCVELTPEGSIRAASPASYNKDELYWLSRIISAESKGEPLLGQIAVGNVVLNRVDSPSYPNTIYGVIFDRKYGTQFSPVSLGTIYQAPSASAVIAAKICLEGYRISDTILFFLNPKIATNHWIEQARPYAFTIGNHQFYN